MFARSRKRECWTSLDRVGKAYESNGCKDVSAPHRPDSVGDLHREPIIQCAGPTLLSKAEKRLTAFNMGMWDMFDVGRRLHD